jgi:hypothetical protein
MKTNAVALVTTLALAGSLTLAGDALAGVNGRQRRQQGRIAQGLRSGALTPREAARLRAEQRWIRREERLYRADGVLGPWDRADLRRDLARASRDIEREKHDGQVR